MTSLIQGIPCLVCSDQLTIFNGRFDAVSERSADGDISRRQAAWELGIGYATLKQLLDSSPSKFHRKPIRNARTPWRHQ